MSQRVGRGGISTSWKTRGRHNDNCVPAFPGQEPSHCILTASSKSSQPWPKSRRSIRTAISSVPSGLWISSPLGDGCRGARYNFPQRSRRGPENLGLLKPARGSRTARHQCRLSCSYFEQVSAQYFIKTTHMIMHVDVPQIFLKRKKSCSSPTMIRQFGCSYNDGSLSDYLLGE